jgi:hypothetical protein
MKKFNVTLLSFLVTLQVHAEDKASTTLTAIDINGTSVPLVQAFTAEACSLFVKQVPANKDLHFYCTSAIVKPEQDKAHLFMLSNNKETFLGVGINNTTCKWMADILTRGMESQAFFFCDNIHARWGRKSESK